MLFYSIQHHGDIGCLKWLVTLLEHPHNQLEIRYDGGIDNFSILERDIAVENLSAENITIVRSRPVYWCGPSQAHAIIDAIRGALEKSGWEFYINLSGACFPLHPQHVIRARIQEMGRNDIAASFFSFPVRKPRQLPISTATGEIVEATVVGRLVLRGAPSLLDQFQTAAYFPLRNVQNRLYLKCLEVNDERKTLEIARPSELELRDRDYFFEKHTHYCGPAWYILHRSACEDIIKFIESSDSSSFREIFFNSFEPDESFLPTIVRGMSVIGADRVSNKSLRAFEGSMRKISDTNLGILEGEWSGLFARKIDHKHSKNLMKIIELRCHK